MSKARCFSVPYFLGILEIKCKVFTTWGILLCIHGGDGKGRCIGEATAE